MFDVETDVKMLDPCDIIEFKIGTKELRCMVLKNIKNGMLMVRHPKYGDFVIDTNHIEVNLVK